MVTIFINGKVVHARENATILEASREDFYASKQYDVKVPSIHFLPGVVNEDHSGICVVEVEGMDGLVNASVTKVTEGMKVHTLTPTVLDAQKKALDKILETHDVDCRKCHRTGNCELQEIQHYLRHTKAPEDYKYKKYPIDASGIIIRDENKCIRCGRCVAMCTDIQGVGAIKFENDRIIPTSGNTLRDAKCVNCGQCITVCPVGALYERDDVDQILELIANPKKFVVIEVAPSVRASIGEYFAYPIGAETEGKVVAALHAVGFDRVYDTTFGADLTVMEESNEFINRVKNGGTLPLITSCCPGWVTYCEQEMPELIPHISSCKSPQQMFGAVAKSYVAEKEGISKEDVVVVSVMPCTAKKFEITRDSESGTDVDFAITVRELGRMIERSKVSFIAMPNEEFDSPIGKASGAGKIFGATGGVMEAALRTIADRLAGDEPVKVEYTKVRGLEGVKQATYIMGGLAVNVAVVSGLANAKKLLEMTLSGETGFHFIEVMACPGGCINGGGQPQQTASEKMVTNVNALRADVLYRIDKKAPIRKSNENPDIKELYTNYIEAPGSDKALKLLHTTYVKR